MSNDSPAPVREWRNPDAATFRDEILTISSPPVRDSIGIGRRSPPALIAEARLEMRGFVRLRCLGLFA